MEVSGKPTLHPVLFFGGKGAGYFTWLVLLLALTGIPGLREGAKICSGYFAYAALISGWVIILASSFTLGRSIRIGLPTGQTQLRRNGIYRFSRNPMYLGVHLVTLSAMLITLKWWVVLPGLISYYTYHSIVLEEERFLRERFGQEYSQYEKETRRYL